MSSEAPARDALVALAGASIARGSRSFALASRLFDRPTRDRAWLLYAWCRACDDLADGQDHGFELRAVDDPAARLARLTALTEDALAGRTTGEPAFDGLAALMAEVAIPRAYIDEHVAGFALDAEGWRPRTEADLIRYCDHVAGAVGCMMAVVMGVHPDDAPTLARARDLGRAFQLANIARDVREDMAGGRCYLPQDWLDEVGLAADQLLDRPDETARLTLRLTALAERYEASARVGARRLAFRSRWAVLAAAGIYGDIARKVRARGADALDRRVVTRKRAKLAWVARALWQAREAER
ncbi:squalene/phytoene synthase family protein [Sphingomonas changnyeongensis]|uniref:Squalene/phytoene synthase family protein n=1 Tax=Sphingomonas changnyeongensis TaxID=2698679 RepID=A0A7Z2NUX8_9SPHN|nr:phytoene/squalene synthase family protein [Sphingomonas changnyeongensis]QHL89906.1 squalene/phytoene synthase family protein [Sphingomonas changnyeongensis]